MTQSDLRDVVRALVEAAVIVSGDGSVLAANDAFCTIVRKHEDQIGRIQDVVADPGGADEFLRMCGSTRPGIFGSVTLQGADGPMPCRCECGLFRPGGESSQAWILLRFRPAPEASEQFRMLSSKIDALNAEVYRRSVAEDELRTIQKTLERRVDERTSELARANKELRRSNAALEEFARVASHDMHEPLRKIRVLGELLEEQASDQLSEDDRLILSRMNAAAGRMQRLIESLLEYARVSTRVQPFSIVDLNHVIDEVLADLDVSITEHAARVSVGELPILRADGVHMRQLFQNLLSNSLKFGRADVPLEIRLSASAISAANGRQVHEIRVEDNGIGFDPVFAEEIFRPFHRLHSSHQFTGSGLGLAICRAIVERHGGTIRAEGRPDEGAAVIVTLPVATVEPSGQTSPEPAR